MTGYTETFRGDVATWEVDATEHFTVACYYEKFEAATWRFLRLNGVSPEAVRTVAALTHYKAELRNRDIYRIETALIETGDQPIIAHKVFNAETGKLCTTMRQILSDARITGPTVAWDGDEWTHRSVPGDDAGWISSAVDIARPEEADWAGNLSLPGYIHRFSTANSFVMAEFGMTPDYQTRARIGLSTFEFELVFHGIAKPGDMINVESCIAQIGNSSMRFYHRMRNAKTGADLAGLSQFGVQLDLDARHPSRIADELRERAQRLLPQT